MLLRALTLMFLLLAGTGQTFACIAPACCPSMMNCATATGDGLVGDQQIHCAGACIAVAPVEPASSLSKPFAVAVLPQSTTLAVNRNFPPPTPPPDGFAQGYL